MEVYGHSSRTNAPLTARKIIRKQAQHGEVVVAIPPGEATLEEAGRRFIVIAL